MSWNQKYEAVRTGKVMAILGGLTAAEESELIAHLWLKTPKRVLRSLKKASGGIEEKLVERMILHPRATET